MAITSTKMFGVLLWVRRCAELEPENPHDRHAVALKKAEEAVGHVPRELSKIMFKFMEYGGHI